VKSLIIPPNVSKQIDAILRIQCKKTGLFHQK
jgi:hypothetical protein